MTNLVGGLVGSQVQMTDVGTMCPRCGAPARILDGTYRLEQRGPGDVVTVLRTLSQSDAWEIRRLLHDAKRSPTAESLDQAIAALPDQVREIVQDVVSRNNKPGARLAIISLILAILGLLFPKAFEEAGQTVGNAVTTHHAQPAPAEPSPQGLERAIQRAVARYEQQLHDSRTAGKRPRGSRTGRNDQCPCGSATKFKFCHGR